jgi:virginiamycin B lyase
MRKSAILLAFVGAGAALLSNGASAQAQTQKGAGSATLSGGVSSLDEPKMEGVLVSAKKEGSTITTTVVSNSEGLYRFPAGRLEPGHYALTIRAGGYDLDNPASVEILVGKPANADIKLRKTANLAAQLANSDWLTSFPGTPEQKSSIQGCTHCHTLERIARSTHDATEFLSVIDRMSRHPAEAFPLMLQPDRPSRNGSEELTPEQIAQRQKQAEYLASLNLSSGDEWSYPLTIAPRPTGNATQVIVTEYDLPKRTQQPHDVIVDREGTVWYAGFGEPLLAKLDPNTGKITEYPIPVLKPGHIIGNLDLEFDEDQNLWIAMTYQGGIAKFDRMTSKFTIFKLPPELDNDLREFTFVAPNHSKVDGKVWIGDSYTYSILRLDVATGKFEVFEPFSKQRPVIYQVTSDVDNNAVFNVMGRQDVGVVDAKTGKISIYPVPTPRSAPRRGSVDALGRFWFGENRTNKIGAFDTKTHEIQEWAVPIPFYLPYDVAADKYGEAWVVSEFTDSVLRFDSKSGQFTNYLMPRETNMRRAFVDDSGPQIKFWVGNTQRAGIIKVEPLDGPGVAQSKN